MTKHLKIHTREGFQSHHVSDSIACKDIPSRCEDHSSTTADNRARDEGLATAKLTLFEVNGPAVHFSETPYIIDIKQEEQD